MSWIKHNRQYYKRGLIRYINNQTDIIKLKRVADFINSIEDIKRT